MSKDELRRIEKMLLEGETCCVDGLMRYDGYSHEPYEPIAGEPLADQVGSLAELWVFWWWIWGGWSPMPFKAFLSMLAFDVRLYTKECRGDQNKTTGKYLWNIEIELIDGSKICFDKVADFGCLDEPVVR
jgi:hypothetical protein